jgi:alpha-glucoside transport system permease protein
MIRIINGLLAIVAGVGGIVVLFWLLNAAVERLPPRWEHRLKPYVFVGPAIAVLALFLVFPAIRTIYVSFLDARSENFVGLANYQQLATDPDIRSAIFNNILWIIFVPTIAVAVGLVVAVLADRLSPTWEKISKSIIFLPMAISFVGASTIWLFIYTWRPAGRDQIGLLNAIWTAFGGEPQTWLQVDTARLNSFLLMVILIWLQAGFAMVLLSAAIKNVPEDTIEAARIDGATELQIFWRVTIPQIRTTIIVVLTTIVILVLKVFDVVFVMTGGLFETDLVAVRFIREMFSFRQFGRAAAIVVVLIIATIPIMIFNIRQFRQQEAT